MGAVFPCNLGLSSFTPNSNKPDIIISFSSSLEGPYYIVNNLLIFIIVYLVISNEISVYTPCVLVTKTCPASGSICGQSSMAALLITIQVLWFTQS